MSTASPSPSVSSPCPSGASGIHGRMRGTMSATTVSAATGRSATTARTTPATPVGGTRSRLSPVSTTRKATIRSQRSAEVIDGRQNRRYSTNSAGYTATSTKLSSQLHQPTWNAQYGPKAWRVHVTYPPSSGMAAASSAIASATGRLQKIGVSTSRMSVMPGPNAVTVSSIPYGPPLTLKKAIAASGRTPSPRLSSAVSSRPLGGREEPRQLGDPLLDWPFGVDRDLELSVRQAADAPGRGRTERDHQRLAVDAEGIGHREDRVDLLHRHDLKHRRPPPRRIP